MVRKRFNANEKTCIYASDNYNSSTSNNDTRKYFCLRGYYKLLLLLTMTVSIVCFRAYVIDRVIVKGNSMNDTFKNNDVLWVKKFNINQLNRFDVVIIKVNNKYLIKRIIGLPNETLTIKNNQVLINGKVLKDYYRKIQDGGIAANSIQLNQCEYFVIGDNSSESLDSRELGAIPINKIEGKVIARIFPIGDIKIGSTW